MLALANDAVLLQANEKAQFLFPVVLEVLHPGAPTVSADHRRAQPPAEHLLHHLPEEFILGLALGLLHHPEVDGYAQASLIGVEERHHAEPLDGPPVQAAP